MKPDSIKLSWARSFLMQYSFDKIKGTKAARKLPEDFPAIKQAFNEKVQNLIADNNIPEELYSHKFLSDRL